MRYITLEAREMRIYVLVYFGSFMNRLVSLGAGKIFSYVEMLLIGFAWSFFFYFQVLWLKSSASLCEDLSTNVLLVIREPQMNC